jgi:hypothetical protein
VLLALACPSAVNAHDVTLEFTGNLTAESADNPRRGGAGLVASGSWDFSEAWSAYVSAGYLRDFGTRTAETASSGSNIFNFGAGALWLPSEHFATQVMVVGSPLSNQLSATAVPVRAAATDETRAVNIVLSNRTWMLGGLGTFGWASNGLGNFESAVDLSASAVRFDVVQQLIPQGQPQDENFRRVCETASGPLCELYVGAATPLFQARLGASYLATLHRRTDLGLDAAYFLYDRDPSNVGFFTLVALGRTTDVGSGVPILPLRFSLRPSVSHRWSKLSIRVSYQIGLYTVEGALNHLGAIRASWKVNEHLRFTLALSGQVDTIDAEPQDLGGTALFGTTYMF